MEIDEILFKTAEETVKKDLTSQFIETARVLYEQDAVDQLSDENLSFFLTSRRGHIGKALEALAETLVWRKQFNIMKLLDEDFSQQNQLGKLHFYGKAIDQSSILIFTAQRQEEMKTPDDLEKNLRFVVYTIEKARKISNISRITLLMDMNKAKYSKNEVKLAGLLVPLLQKNYPEMLSRCYLFPTNGLFWITYSASKYFLDANTIPKIHLKDSAASINEWIQRDQFYIRFGGSVIEDEYFMEVTRKATSGKEIILKSSNTIEVEEIFIAPLEYQSV